MLLPLVASLIQRSSNSLTAILLCGLIHSSVALHAVALIGKTPCCVDRLTSTTCTRIRQANPIRFESRCTQDPDFALIQCCSSCFPRRDGNSSEKYSGMVLRQLQSPLTSACWDRRGNTWCTKLVQRTGFWDSPRYSHVSCASFPFAFRECRMTCGYCSQGQFLSRIRYDYNIATNPGMCDVKAYFARSEEEMKAIKGRRKLEFDPLALLKLGKYRPDDYFVVTEHNYDIIDSREKFESKEKLFV